MELNDAQKGEVASWFAGGMSLDGIQKRILSDFGVHMTYLDVRLLVAGFPQPEEKEPVGENASPGADAALAREGGLEEPPAPEAGDLPGETAAAPGPGEEANAVPSGVSVSLDPICPPGVIAGGPVSFADGTSGKWYLDQMGRLGLADLPPGYRPSPEDAAELQRSLVDLLRSKGMA